MENSRNVPNVGSFHRIQILEKIKNNKDGQIKECKKCSNEYTTIVTEKIINYKKQYFQQFKENFNKSQKNYVKKKNETDVNFCLIVYTRIRIYKSLKGLTKQSTSSDVMGIDIDTWRRWIYYQFTPEKNWSNIEIDQAEPVTSFDTSKDNGLRQAFNWKDTQTPLKEDHKQKGTKKCLSL